MEKEFTSLNSIMFINLSNNIFVHKATEETMCFNILNKSICLSSLKFFTTLSVREPFWLVPRDKSSVLELFEVIQFFWLVPRVRSSVLELFEVIQFSCKCASLW